MYQGGGWYVKEERNHIYVIPKVNGLGFFARV
jgi:hypothetical protein